MSDKGNLLNMICETVGIAPMTETRIFIDAQKEDGNYLWRSYVLMLTEQNYKELTSDPVGFAKDALFQTEGIQAKKIGMVLFTTDDLDGDEVYEYATNMKPDSIEFMQKHFRPLYLDLNY